MYTVLPYSEFVGGGVVPNDPIDEITSLLQNSSLKKMPSFKKIPSVKKMPSFKKIPSVKNPITKSRTSERIRHLDQVERLAETEELLKKLMSEKEIPKEKAKPKNMNKAGGFISYPDVIVDSILMKGFGFNKAFVDHLRSNMVNTETSVVLNRNNIKDVLESIDTLNFLVDLVLVDIVWVKDNNTIVDELTNQTFDIFYKRASGQHTIISLVNTWQDNKKIVNNRIVYGNLTFTSYVDTASRVKEIKMQPKYAMHELVRNRLLYEVMNKYAKFQTDMEE
jgi:hypothetical protein